METKIISVVLPLLNEEENLLPLVEEIKKRIPPKYAYEIILVDDGSTDSTLEKVRHLTQTDHQIKGISFYTNFGHQAALFAGIEQATGEAVITMDADFQHPPELIPSMITRWEQGHDLVVAQKKRDASSPILLRLIRLVGYPLYKVLGGGKFFPGVSDFRLMSRPIADYVKSCSEARYILRGLVMIPAKSISFIPYAVPKRRAGKSSYNLGKLFSLYLYSITSFSLALLRMASISGLLLILLSFLYLAYVLYVKLVLGRAIISGWTALVFLVVFLFGFLLFYLGILSEYIGAVFDEVKKRPRYLIRETFNCQE
jgi:dolichol-phosphate mannosyltransferase